MARGGSASSARRTVVGPAPTKDELGLGRERVSEIQRVRLLAAMAEVACERGAGGSAVAHVVERAGVSRRAFYEIFEDREDCFLAAFEEAIDRARRYVLNGFDPEAGWAERVRGALEAVLRFLEDEPAMGRLAVVESVGAGARVLGLRRLVIDLVVKVVDEGREGMAAGSSATSLTAEGVVGGVLSVIHGRLASSEPGSLAGLANPLMSMIALPYLGPAAARKEMERPIAKRPAQLAAASANPLKGLDMRLTYRTVRALAAIAAYPESSNRLIGEVSGIGDQGQVSKLLARLQRLGLVENTPTGPSRGAANGWSLTERGEEVADVIPTQPVA